MFYKIWYKRVNEYGKTDSYFLVKAFSLKHAIKDFIEKFCVFDISDAVLYYSFNSYNTKRLFINSITIEYTDRFIDTFYIEQIDIYKNKQYIKTLKNK